VRFPELPRWFGRGCLNPPGARTLADMSDDEPHVDPPRETPRCPVCGAAHASFGWTIVKHSSLRVRGSLDLVEIAEPVARVIDARCGAFGPAKLSMAS
jgi:hypothetical protein